MRTLRSFSVVLGTLLVVIPWNSSDAQTVTLDFASVTLPPGGCTDASAYLATFGITFVPVSSGASAQICNATGSAIFPTSSPNFFFIGPSVTNTDVSGNLVFATAVSQITIGTTAVNPVTSVPAWDALVYDSSNTLLNSVSEPSLYPGPGALSFTLNGTGITRLHFDAFNSAARTFNAPPIDHITLTENCQVNPGDVNRFAGGSYSLDGKPTALIATFTPTDANGLPIGLDAAKAACGVKEFNWEQTITTWPSPSTLVSLNPAEFQQKLGYAPPPAFVTPPSIPDPPPGGYTYFPLRGWASWDSYPFYYDASFPGSTSNCLSWDGTAGTYAWALDSHKTTNTLCFVDAPADPCLLGGSGKGCSGFAQQFGDLRFSTRLVGVRSDNTVLDLYDWNWISTFNGTSGGIVSTSSLNPVDPGSGSGGVTITSINGVPQTPPTTTCTVTPSTLWPPNGKAVSVTVSGTITPGTSSLVPGGTAYLVIDSYGQDQPSGQITLGSGGSYSSQVSLIAARNGNDTNGRTYTVIVNGQDTLGNVGSCSTVVTVPHDQGH